VTKGYYNNPAANAETFKNGWLRTGDIAYCDGKSKKWYIVDRKKELIKVRGFQVGPIEVEGVLMSHPRIMDAAVIGVPVALLEFAKTDSEKRAAMSGELIRAYVVGRPGPGDQLQEEEILEWVGKRLAKYKQITGGIVFIDVLPRNATGKIMKNELRKRAKMEMKRSAGSRL
jgi:acyl-CoA synthetase (AMP-forming)/AMP-acid ligase II